MRELIEDYFGPADWARVHREEGLSEAKPISGHPLKEISISYSDNEFALLLRGRGIPETNVHVLRAVPRILAKAPLPQVPNEKLGAMEDLVVGFFGIFEDGEVNWKDLDNVDEIIRGIVALLPKKK